jgi:FkbM family methyltransferase
MLAEWAWDRATFALGFTRRLPALPDWSVICHPEAYRVFHDAQVADPVQREEFLSFATQCDTKMLLFDIGAHYGIFSLAAAHRGGRAIAIDASPAALRMISTEARLNGLESRVQTLHAGVGETSGEMEMLSSGVFSYGYFTVSAGRAQTELTRVPAVTVDELSPRFGPPTHLKIDVEGHELAVLRGARETLTRYSPLLFIELHNEMVAAAGSSPAETLNEITRNGYQVFGVDGQPADATATLNVPIARIVAKTVAHHNAAAGHWFRTTAS